jgi:DNA-binding NtrC family response regulator
MNYSWPGNVRQLLNFTERLVLMCRTTFNIAIFDKHIEDLHQYQPVSTDHQGNGKMNSIRHKLIQNHRAFETEMILDALEKCQYNKGKAARLLGISRTTLWKKMKQLDAS